jgi:site-specific DNA-cytosine methylase
MLTTLKHGKRGGVMPTLNAMDNNGEAFATALILMEEGKPVIMRNREGCAGGGKGLMYSDKSFTLATSNDQFLIIDGTRVDDVRVYEDGIVPTVISRYGTGGGNVPMIAFDTYNQTTNETTTQALRSTASDVDHIGAVLSQATVRRLTPTECERLQGFPDNWTDGQADSNRYKQMGNAVAVPVVQWIINRMVGDE